MPPTPSQLHESSQKSKPCGLYWLSSAQLFFFLYATLSELLLFLQTEKDIVSKKVVTYPLLGEQEMYKDVLNEFDFHCVSQSVLKFDFETPLCLIRINRTKRQEMPEGYEVISL